MQQKQNHPDSLSRRQFIQTSAAGMAAVVAGKSVIFAASARRKFRIGLLGCGDRGTKALGNLLDAAKVVDVDIETIATADWFKSKAETAGQKYNVPAERCFGGGDAYKKMLEANPDIVVMATPPNFRPVHFEAAVKAGKHVFMEKPVAVDPPGARQIMAAGEIAKEKGLSVVAGTQRRHQGNYLKTQYAVSQGAIGTIVGGCIWWCQDALWHKKREPNESDADYLVRNWVSFSAMSGDHIVEQHVHNIDIANWYIGHPPVAAVGFGGRARRKTGDQYDFFSVDFDYGGGCHIHSMCRQISGTDGQVREYFKGTEGETTGESGLKGKPVADTRQYSDRNPYIQEHVDLLKSIIAGQPINEARDVASSTLTAIMARISAYTGKLVTWRQVAEDATSPYYSLALKPTPQDFETGQVVAPPDDVAAIPGRDA
jgi:myo-inositol 2-dehydrogenase/D-chiro-inositol 1-dehydrogenase